MSQAKDLRAGLRYEAGGRVDHTSIEPDEYCRLVISSRQLERWDDSASRLRGLWDPIDGKWFVVAEDNLQDSSLSHLQLDSSYR
jgi:hypothetical protein